MPESGGTNRRHASLQAYLVTTALCVFLVGLGTYNLDRGHIVNGLFLIVLAAVLPVMALLWGLLVLSVKFKQRGVHEER